MDNASKNANEMISKLQMQFNRQRQAVITNELVDIIVRRVSCTMMQQILRLNALSLFQIPADRCIRALSHVSMREWRVDLKAVEDILPSVFAIDELAMKGARLPRPRFAC